MEEIVVENNPKPKSFFKKLIRFLLWCFSLALLFVLSLITLLFVCEDEVKAAIVTELNKHLKAEVQIDPKNIDLTIIKTFPDCSIEFKNVLMLEALPKTGKRDTLLFAGQLNLHFNIQNLWNKKYDIEKIKLKNAVAKLQVFKNGKNNYTFWVESDTENGAAENLNFNLKLITVNNCRLSYKHNSTLFKAELMVESLQFKGHFGQEQFDLSTKAKLGIQQIAQAKTVYLKEKTLDISVDLDVNKNDYTLKTTSLHLNNMALEVNGGFRYKDSLEHLSINYHAPNLDIASVLSLLPASFKSEINDYESSGNFYAKGKFNYINKKSYSFVSDFGIKNGNITYKPQLAEATNVNVEGVLQISNSGSELRIKNIFLNLNNDEVKGQCFIKDFSQPYLQISAQANVHLENLIKFFPIDTLTLLKGEVKINSEIEGALEDLKNQTFSSKVKLEVNASVSALQAQFKGDEKVYSIENCSLIAQERDIEVKDLILKRGNSDLTVNGKIPKLFNHLLDRKELLIINGTLFSGNLRMEDFMPKNSSSGATGGSPLIPENIRLNLNAEISKFSFAKFEARNISGNIEVKNQKAIVSDVKLKTMDGEAEINAFADNSKNKLDVVLQSNFKNINITELFSQFHNFGQETLQDRNLKGVASATIDFSGTWNNNIDADYNSLKVVSSINIERGELSDFSPLLSLSKFVDIQDLRHIRFSTLQSMVQINNSVISIAKTSIKNSALNIDVWGTHTFDNKIDYHFQLLISELLAKKRKKKDDEFGPIENDKENRRSAFVVMTGTVDNPIIKYDGKGLKEKVKADMKAEKQNIRQILKEEFGMFKKDSTPRNGDKSEQLFELEKSTNNTPSKKTLELKKKTEDEEDF